MTRTNLSNFVENPQVEALQIRWGSAITRGSTGFTAIPNVLIRYQSKLELSSVEFVVLLNLLTHWWRNDELPYVRLPTIAFRIGVSRRTVERAIQSLEDRELIRRLPAERSQVHLTIRRFDLSGLVIKLREFADIHREMYGERDAV